MLIGLAVVVVLLAALSGHVVSAIETLAEYWLLLAVVAAIYAVTSVSGRRRQLEESRSNRGSSPRPSRRGVCSFRRRFACCCRCSCSSLQ